MRPESNRRRSRFTVVKLLALLAVLAVSVLLAMADALWPAQGNDLRSEDGLTVDCTNASQGYVLCKVQQVSSKIKLRISCGDMIYTYDLNNKGNYEVFPLQMGSGNYTFTTYRQVSGNRYTKQAEITVRVNMPDENSAFLYPSQYVNYTSESAAVAKSYEICEGLTTDREKLEAIRDFLVGNFTYDYVRALTSPESYLGDVDGCFKTRMGLCQDLSVIAACMLRVQGIPTQMAIGQAGSVYHAWNYVLIDGEYELLDVTGEITFAAPNTVYEVDRIY